MNSCPSAEKKESVVDGKEIAGISDEGDKTGKFENEKGENRSPVPSLWMDSCIRWIQWIRQRVPHCVSHIRTTGTGPVTIATVAAAVTIWMIWQKRNKILKNTPTLELLERHHSDHSNRSHASPPTSASIPVVPLSLLLSAVEKGQILKALLGTSRILFQIKEEASSNAQQYSQRYPKTSTDSTKTPWRQIRLPTNNETLKKQVFAVVSKASQNAEVSVLVERDFSAVATGILAALPFVYLALVYRMMRDQMGDSKSKHISHSSTLSSTKTFANVAGLDSAVMELSEIVEYLRSPSRYRQYGARSPRGVLLHGPPGTGKTLLAQAMAGEANVSTFLACSASDFVELYVGRGAARVRSLFQSARKQAREQWHYQERIRRRNAFWRWLQHNVPLFNSANSNINSNLSIERDFVAADTKKENGSASERPCCSAIIFIDELDALAKSRSFGLTSSNDEREQTLNQLLTEMDGFQSQASSGNDSSVHEDLEITVIVVAASNRADVLDPAILRRFDRQIHVGYPDNAGREAILRIHAQNIATDESDVCDYNHTNPCSNLHASSPHIDWKKLATEEITGGMSGSDLRNLVNEAALLAVRENRQDRVVSHHHLEHAARRVRQMKTSLHINAV